MVSTLQKRNKAFLDKNGDKTYQNLWNIFVRLKFRAMSAYNLRDLK